MLVPPQVISWNLLGELLDLGWFLQCGELMYF